MTAVVLNKGYAHQLLDGVLATRVPAGHWSVKVRQVGTVWVGFAVPRSGNTWPPFDVVSGFDRDAVHGAAAQWATSAEILAMHPGRVVFAGLGDAIDETDLDLLVVPIGVAA